jgi:hypothetical protein
MGGMMQGRQGDMMSQGGMMEGMMGMMSQMSGMMEHCNEMMQAMDDGHTRQPNDQWRSPHPEQPAQPRE